MKNILLLTLFLGLITAASASNIVVMVVEDPNNYEAPRTMRDFAEKQLRPLGHHVTIIDGGKPLTEFMRYGDTVRIEMFDAAGKSIFGAIDQRVARYTP